MMFSLKFEFKRSGEKEVHGDLLLNCGHLGEIKFPSVSGKWGKGNLPVGSYTAKYFRDETGDAFSLFGVGFFIYIEPKFKTDRSELGIHPDGNVPGTLGCIGLKLKDKPEAEFSKSIFKLAFYFMSEIPLTVTEAKT